MMNTEEVIHPLLKLIKEERDNGFQAYDTQIGLYASRSNWHSERVISSGRQSIWDLREMTPMLMQSVEMVFEIPELTLERIIVSRKGDYQASAKFDICFYKRTDASQQVVSVSNPLLLLGDILNTPLIVLIRATRTLLSHFNNITSILTNQRCFMRLVIAFEDNDKCCLIVEQNKKTETGI